MRIYVVMGTAGEYSDREEWPVIAYSDRSRAKEHVIKATQYIKNHIATCEKSYHEDKCRRAIRSPLDPKAQIDYAGCGYFFYAVELAEP